MSDEKDDNWEMPKPVFRSTDGAVPRNLEDTISLSFAPNRAAPEAEESDDILGIMGSNDDDQVYQQAYSDDHESILETESSVENIPVNKGLWNDPVFASAPNASVNPTETDPVSQPTQADPVRGDLLTYIAMILIIAGLFVASVYYYFGPAPPVR